MLSTWKAYHVFLCCIHIPMSTRCTLKNIIYQNTNKWPKLITNSFIYRREYTQPTGVVVMVEEGYRQINGNQVSNICSPTSLIHFGIVATAALMTVNLVSLRNPVTDNREKNPGPVTKNLLIVASRTCIWVDKVCWVKEVRFPRWFRDGNIDSYTDVRPGSWNLSLEGRMQSE